VVGGGEVAARKAEALIERNADVMVVSPAACPQMGHLAATGKLRLLRREYRPEDLDEALLAIAATDDALVNSKVARDARRRRVLVNVVDDADHSDFIVPSSLKRGAMTVAVSTAGTSPALARRIRTRLENILGPEYASLAELVGGVRAELRAGGITVTAETWQQALDLESLLALLREGKDEQARLLLLDNLGVGAARSTEARVGGQS